MIYLFGTAADPSSKNTELRRGKVSLTSRLAGTDFGPRTENITSRTGTATIGDSVAGAFLAFPNFNAIPALTVEIDKLSISRGSWPKYG